MVSEFDIYLFIFDHPESTKIEKSGHVVKGQSKYSKCFSEGWAIQVGLVGGVPTELQHHYLS